MDEKPTQHSAEVVIFDLEDQRYAIPTATVVEIVRAVTVTRLPKAPLIVMGVIDFRGTIIPVLNIRERFLRSSKEVELQDHFIIAWAGDRMAALQVDRAVAFTRIQDEDVQETKRIAPAAEYIEGVARLSDGLVLIHNLKAFLSEAESTMLAESLAAREGA